MNSIEEILREIGPSLSSDLAKAVSQKYNISNAAARQRVSRGCDGLRKLPFVNFPNNSKFLYLEKDFGSPFYWDKLELAFLKSPSAYSVAYLAIKSRGGIIPKAHFNCICGSPVRQKKHIPAKSVLYNLVNSKILCERFINGLGDCIITGEIARDNSEHELLEKSIRATTRIIIEENIVIPSLIKWIFRIGFSSKNTVKHREKNNYPKVLNFEWDVTAPSYLNLLANTNQHPKKPGFLACDVFIEDNVNINMIDAFLKKCETCSNSSKNTNILYIFLAKSFEKDALIKARSSGNMLPLSLETMMGVKFSEGIDLLAKTINENISNQLNSETYKKILDSFEGIKGVYNNVRGLLFELLCFEIISKLERPNHIERSKRVKVIINEEKQEAEIDIFHEIINQKRTYIECKGWGKDSTLDDEEVNKWLNKRIPRIMKSVKDEGINTQKIKINHEIWVTCKLTEKSLNMIQEENKKTKKFNIEIKYNKDIEIMAKETGEAEILKTYRDIFIDRKKKYQVKDLSIDLKDSDIGSSIKNEIDNELDTLLEDIEPFDENIPF